MTIAALGSVPVSPKDLIQELQRRMRRDGKASLAGRGEEPALELPDVVSSALLRILECMQEGQAVSIVPVMQDLTTQEAAGFLGVSRPFLIKLLESGKLRFHRTGTHRRVYMKDLIDFRERRDREKSDALDRIGQFEEEAGLYDKVLLPD